MQNQFDDFDAQLQCEDVQGDYIPTEQDLLDMEVAFALDPMEVVSNWMQLWKNSTPVLSSMIHSRCHRGRQNSSRIYLKGNKSPTIVEGGHRRTEPLQGITLQVRFLYSTCHNFVTVPDLQS